MKYLNLTEGFNPYNAQEHEIIEHESFTFKGGEPHVKLKDFNQHTNVTVTCRLSNFEDVGTLLVAVEALRQSGYLKESYLFIPYLPGGRQDRRVEAGEPLTVKVYADIINSMEFDCVTIMDPHSDVSTALLDNAISVNNHPIVNAVLGDIATSMEEVPGSCYNIIAPDFGAAKKAENLVTYLSNIIYDLDNTPLFDTNDRLIYCQKKRDTSTGELSGFKVHAEDLRNTPCFIVDDICDGGGTFLGLAKELKKKNAGNLYLIVTHGIFSKGLHELCKAFKGVYTTNSLDSLKFHEGVVPRNFNCVHLNKSLIV